MSRPFVTRGFPRLYAAASLKRAARARPAAWRAGFPRLYAAASLKQREAGARPHVALGFSAALCRGLIEASPTPTAGSRPPTVFRGFMPRPH